ncbi:MAG TPA: hypothetical protein VFN96_08215 [Gemmatimonadales bacterium]|nr:hypothetical protein [Gemmatimonadales bacterium]
MSRRGPVGEAPAPLRDVMIVGGGCYGTFYATQLDRARSRGGLSVRNILVVDRDPACRATRELPAGRVTHITREWEAYLGEFLAAAPPGQSEPDDAIVPSPLMPHLFARWLLGVARTRWPGRAAELATPAVPMGTPYDAVGPDGVRYVSFADWICPTHCIEPLTCPVIRAPRTWEMGDALAEYARRLGRERPTAGPALFTTRHHAYGVGLISAGEARAALALLEEAGRAAESDLLVGTVSACHGAASLLRLGAPAS